MTTFAPTPPPRAHRTGQGPGSVQALQVEWPLVCEGPATLAISVEAGTASAMLIRLDGRRSLATSSVVVTADGELEHLDAPGVLSMTLRLRGDATGEVLYARTPLLESLGVTGGCIERPRLTAP